MLRLAVSLLPIALACSGGNQAPSEPDADPGLTEFTISNTDDSGEIHSLTIVCESLLSDTAITLTTGGDHQHSVRLEVADLEAILEGASVTVTFTDGHAHSFTILKPDDACLGTSRG